MRITVKKHLFMSQIYVDISRPKRNLDTRMQVDSLKHQISSEIKDHRDGRVSIWNQRNIKTNCWFPNRRKRGSWCKKRLIHQTASRQSIGFDKGLRRYCWKIPTTIGISSNRYGYAKTYKSKNKSFKTRIKLWFPEMCIIEIIVS